MSAMGAEDESGTVREEGTCGEGKVVEGKQPIEKSEYTVMSPQAHKLGNLRSSHDTVPPSSTHIIFDRSFSTRSVFGGRIVSVSEI